MSPYLGEFITSLITDRIGRLIIRTTISEKEKEPGYKKDKKFCKKKLTAMKCNRFLVHF